MSMTKRKTSSANHSSGGGLETTTRDYVVDDSSVKYKWAGGLVEIIQFILNILTTYIFIILEFLFNISPCKFFRQTWNFVLTTMTIEIVTTATATKEEEREYFRRDSDTSYDGVTDEEKTVEITQKLVSQVEAIFLDDNTSDDGITDEEKTVENTQELVNQVEIIFSNDTSDDGITDEEKTIEITQKLVSQVEAMFSDEHLAKDGFLLKHVRRRSDGYVSLKLVAGLRKVKQISRDFPTVLAALRLSLKLDVNLDGTKVRRMEPLTPFLKSLPISGGNKEGSVPNNKARLSADLTHDELINRVSMRNCANTINQQQNGQQHRKISRNSSNSSTTGSSNGSSRNGSFSKHYHAGASPADLFYRNVHALSADDTPQVNRRRGGSLPIPMNGNPHTNVSVGGPSPTYYHYQRNSMYLSPNSSPPSGSEISQRPKSNSYCEGTIKNSPSGNGNNGMSVWLQRRKTSASTKSSEGTIVLAGVVRQPRGPDGTKGFANGFRHLILEEKENLSSCSA